MRIAILHVRHQQASALIAVRPWGRGCIDRTKAALAAPWEGHAQFNEGRRKFVKNSASVYVCNIKLYAQVSHYYMHNYMHNYMHKFPTSTYSNLFTLQDSAGPLSFLFFLFVLSTFIN